MIDSFLYSYITRLVLLLFIIILCHNSFQNDNSAVKLLQKHNISVPFALPTELSYETKEYYRMHVEFKSTKEKKD